MTHLRIKAEIKRDNTGNTIHLPTLLIERDGKFQVFEQLLNYQIKYSVRSITWHNKLIQVVGLLLDYMEANQNNYTSPIKYFESFAEAIYSGTINEEGLDPSGLYWLHRNAETANVLLRLLSEFSDWLHKEYGAVQLNPWREATTFEQRLKFMAKVNKEQHCFLAHLNDIHDISQSSLNVRNFVNKRGSSPSSFIDVKSFPEDQIDNLLCNGFKWDGYKKTSYYKKLSKKERKNFKPDDVDSYNWRDICITILMHGGGLRLSETFHLWTDDVYVDPCDPNLAEVRIYEPSEGKVPKALKSLKHPITGKNITNRETYLRLKYGLRPRNQYTDRRHAGWKHPKLDNITDKYIRVYWFSKEWGYFFMRAWRMYLRQRNRYDIPEKNPYAFVTYSDRYDGKEKGNMLTMDSYRETHKNAVEKIGLEYGKYFGTTPHGHRHACGKRLRMAGVSPMTIQIVLHHLSMKSQEVYTAPNAIEVTGELDNATKLLDSGIRTLPLNTGIYNVTDSSLLLEEEYEKRMRYIKGAK